MKLKQWSITDTRPTLKCVYFCLPNNCSSVNWYEACNSIVRIALDTDDIIFYSTTPIVSKACVTIVRPWGNNPMKQRWYTVIVLNDTLQMATLHRYVVKRVIISERKSVNRSGEQLSG